MTFKKWSETVETEYTCEFGQGGEWVRDVYSLPCGVKVHDEICFPRSPFRKQHGQTLVDFMLPVSKAPWLKETYGAEFDEQRYTEDGFGYPLFTGEDSLERAFNFMGKEHEALSVEFTVHS